MCLCADLILTIYSPFSPAYNRLKFYYGFSLTVSTILIFIIYGLDEASSKGSEFACIENTTDKSFQKIQDKANLVLAITLSCYIVVAIYSTVYSYRRLHRPGVSAFVRTLFVKKHFLYVVVFIFIWMI